MSDPQPHDQDDGRAASSPAFGSAAWQPYGVAVVAVVAATFLMSALYGVGGIERGSIPFIFYFGAVILSARYGGRGPGLFSVVLSVLTAKYFFIPPFGKLAFNYESVLQSVIFVLVAFVIVSLTEQSRRAEAQARASEESLSTTLRSIGDAVIATDAAGSITFMNPIAERLTGWATAEARGRPLTEVFRIINEETRREVESPVEKVLREGIIVGLSNHTLLISKSGVETPIDDTGAPIKNKSGRIVGVVLVFHDITERRLAEKALKESEERFHMLADSAPVMIWVNSLTGCEFVNRSYLEFLGRTYDEVLRMDWATALHPDDAAGYLSAYLAAFEARVPFEAQFRFRRGDGEYRWLKSVGLPRFTPGGAFLGYIGSSFDITDLKLSATALRDSEERYRLLFESNPHPMWVYDLESFAFLAVNDAAVRHYGYTRDEFLAMTIKDIRPPEDIPRLLENVSRARPGLDDVGKWRHLKKSGAVIDVEIISHSLVFDGRRAELVLANDITERKRAEDELRASEARYRALAAAMPQIVWTARPDGYIDYYNKRWFDYTGMTLEQTQGWGWQPVLHPDDVEPCLRRWATSVETGEDYEIEYRFRRAVDGQYRWHLGRAEPMRDADGRIVKWFGAATDIHDQKQTAERLRFLSDANALLTSSLDYETTLAHLARLSVLTLADHCLIDLIGDDGEVRRVATAHANPSKEELVRDLRRFPPAPGEAEGIPTVLRTGRSEIISDLTEEMLPALARGEEHLAALRRLGPKSFMTVPLNARARTIGAITIGLDEPGRRYTRADLVFAEELARRAALAIDNARLYSRAQESNRAKDEFLAMLSHELRTPLTPIMGWIGMIRAGYLAEENIEQGLEVIDKSSQSLLRLISDLLDMTSIMSGKMRIEREAVGLEGLVSEAVQTVRPQAAASGITLDLSCDAGAATALVSGDRTRLVQVLWNLFSNAVKFSPRGARVRVECRADDATAHVEVSDEGSGIAPEFLSRVFDRFSQADSSTTRAYGGLGLGLALVKSFVEAHGGVVKAFSAGPGRGSHFTVTLPRLRIEEERTESRSASGGRDSREHESAIHNPQSAIEASAIHHSQSVRVLVVEDERDTLEMLQIVFGMRGYEAVTCASAEEALRVAPSAWFDIIVSDIGLPRIDGYELIKRLREVSHLRDTPALALTGYAARTDTEAALAAGFDAHVPKPVEPSVLADEIERLLRQGRSGRKSRPPAA